MNLLCIVLFLVFNNKDKCDPHQKKLNNLRNQNERQWLGVHRKEREMSSSCKRRMEASGQDVILSSKRMSDSPLLKLDSNIIHRQIHVCLQLGIENTRGG